MRIVKFLFFSMIVVAVGEPAMAWVVDHVLHLPTCMGGVVILVVLVAALYFEPVQSFAPEVHKSNPDASRPDDGEDHAVKLTVPPLPFTPRHITAGFNQYAEQLESVVRGTHTLNRYGTVWHKSPAPPRLFGVG
jgi:hypothetical protein